MKKRHRHLNLLKNLDFDYYISGFSDFILASARKQFSGPTQGAAPPAPTPTCYVHGHACVPACLRACLTACVRASLRALCCVRACVFPSERISRVVAGGPRTNRFSVVRLSGGVSGWVDHPLQLLHLSPVFPNRKNQISF